VNRDEVLPLRNGEELLASNQRMKALQLNVDEVSALRGLPCLGLPLQRRRGGPDGRAAGSDGVSSAALEALEEAAGSKVPALGYTVPYAVGNTLLTLAGPLLVALIR
jgi:hypothetical protein